METNPRASNPGASNPSRARKWLVTGAIAGGVALGAAGIANAATGASSVTATAAAPSSASAAPAAAAPDPATMSHGPSETLLTGTTAAKVKAAALAAVPGATVIRVETDSAGSPYEAHLRKSDGTDVTVKVDASFKVTATQSGFGAGPGGRPGGPSGAPAGQAPTAAPASGVNA